MRDSSPAWGGAFRLNNLAIDLRLRFDTSRLGIIKCAFWQSWRWHSLLHLLCQHMLATSIEPRLSIERRSIIRVRSWAIRLVVRSWAIGAAVVVRSKARMITISTTGCTATSTTAIG